MPLDLFRPFLLLVLLANVAIGRDWTRSATAEVTWEGNVTNANRAADEIETLRVASDLAVSHRYSPTGSTAAIPAFHLGAEWFPDYRGLSRLLPGVQIEYQYKHGLGPMAPVIACRAAVDGLIVRENPRHGVMGNAQLAVRKRFGSTMRFELVQDVTHRETRDRTFGGTSYETAARLTFDLSETIQLSVSGFGRTGDIVSHATPPRPELVALASSRVTVDTFDHPMVAYSFRANTVGGAAMIGVRLAMRTQATLGYTYSETSRSTLRYRNPLVSVAIVHQLQRRLLPFAFPLPPRPVRFVALASIALSSLGAAEAVVRVNDNKGAPVADAAVSFFALDGNSSSAAAPSGAAIEIEQRGQEFAPYVTVVQTGTSIRLPNRDTVQHHVYSEAAAKRFELPLYAQARRKR